MNQPFTIILPTRPQADTIVAIFLLQKFGKEKFPGVEHATVATKDAISPDETFDSLVQKNILAIDVGGGPFDHHGKDYCASELVAQYLGVEKNPALTQLLQYTRRDDREGKGTLSKDPIDRAFGLSGLISALRKLHPTEPQKVVEAVLPLLEAQYHSANEHHVELPREVEEKKTRNEYEEMTATTTQGKKLKISCVISDKPAMPTFLRSTRGPRADVVIQKAEKTNHLCILTRQELKLDLSKAAALIRLREAGLRGVELSNDNDYLGKTGRIDEVSYWYYDPATNSLLNGGPHNTSVEESQISWDELKKIVVAGLELS